MLGNEVRAWDGALKSHEIKYFYELEKKERNEKSLKIMIKPLKIMMQYKSKENMDYRPSITFSILWFIFNAMEFTLYFRVVISYQSLFSVRCFQIFSRVAASNNLSFWNNTPCVRIYYCTISLRNHRLFLIPHFELWNLSPTNQPVNKNKWLPWIV